MPANSSSFSYEHDGLIKGLNSTSYYDYYNRLIDRYQKERGDLIWKEGTFDDNQLVKERYTDPVEFISHTAPLSSTSLLFANRKNGYLAYTNEIPETPLDPIAGLDFLTVSSFFEYLARVKGTAYEGFFYVGKQLSCYAEITDNVHVITKNGKIPLLFFAESFSYEESSDKSSGVIGVATLKSPYYSDITLNVYTADSTSYLDKYFIYSQTSDKDPHPVGKIPGEPIYKTFVINGYDTAITKVKVGDTIIDAGSAAATTSVIGTDSRFYKDYIGFRWSGSGKLEVGFNFLLKTDPLESVDFDISLYVNGAWTDPQTCTVYFADNEFSSLTPTITIDPQDMYLDVPTVYTLRAENRYFLTSYQYREKTDLYYLDKTMEVGMKYLRTESSKYLYQTDSVTVPSEEGRKPNEYLFVITNTYGAVNNFWIPIWMYGYTTNEINRIPDDFIIVTPKLLTSLIYTEYKKSEYTFEFTWRGTIDLIGVELKRVSDDYGYFRTEDFIWEKVSLSNGVWTYKLVLDKKIIAEPIDITQVPIRILFNYKVQRKDLSQSNWPADTIHGTMTITYVKDRWEIVNASIDNKLLGDAVIYYKIRDKLLDLYTDKYSDDLRLAPEGTMVFSSNISKPTEVMDWDIRTKTWQSSIKILSYGDITLQFKGVNATSNTVTLKHDLPEHPLKATPVIKNAYVYVMCRTVINLSYNDKITSISVDGGLVGDRTPFKLDDVKDGYAYLSPIYNSTRTEVIAVAIDYVPLKQGNIDVSFNFTSVNDYDYSNFPLAVSFTIPVRPQSEKVNFTFILGDDFEFGKNSTGKLKLNDTLLADGKVVASIKNASNNVVVAKPNFNPVGGGDFDTVNIYIDTYLSDQKDYYLDFEVYEYTNASKDNDLPYQLYYLARIPFKVP